MLKKFTMIMTLCGFSSYALHASLQVAIPLEDFQAGNSIVLIARDIDGKEQVAGRVALQIGKTQFSYEEIVCQDHSLSSIADQKSTVIQHVEKALIPADDNLIYLYFEVDPKDVVRVLIIKNTFLADNPFDIVEFSSATLMDDEDDFFSCADDELSQLNLTDVHVQTPAPLSYYDKAMLAACAFWAIQSSQFKQAYKKVSRWFVKDYEK